MVSSATPEDVQSIIGFDEGPVPKEYNYELEKRGIKVIERVLYEEGVETLKLYVKTGGFVYNSAGNTNAPTHKTHEHSK